MVDTRKELALRGRIAELELAVESKDIVIKHLESRGSGGLQLPDPVIFTNVVVNGARAITYTFWEGQMKHKLNADTESSLETRMAYIAPNRFTHTDQMFEVLAKVYRIEKDVAYRDFQALKQPETVRSFTIFWERFQFFYDRSGRQFTEEQITASLYNKLNPRLKAAFPATQDPTITLEQMVAKCLSMDK